MSKVNADIGEITCAWCSSVVPVRKNRNSKLYVACSNCGQQPLNAQGGQDIILERATIYGAAPKAAPVEPAKNPEPIEKPIETPPEKPRKSSGFSFLDM
ncbi:hypothetical protein [Thalassotalea castellviae]|uniref:Zinc ribbon domain-containing protein n=1 Tax=Thalassotalea castellviae TaxID=3075612 RepID=A0ABU3A3E0_9GAMM|nr:hypothetical protein [Thalassotalea sp. W431]MDT0603496.1 hypothetical protein [Thalassotalea sp. W431]